MCQGTTSVVPQVIYLGSGFSRGELQTSEKQKDAGAKAQYFFYCSFGTTEVVP
jgi:hypothetical protein